MGQGLLWVILIRELESWVRVMWESSITIPELTICLWLDWSSSIGMIELLAASSTN